MNQQTDLSKKLRAHVSGHVGMATNTDNKLLLDAADEIERYYAGMLNWKNSAEAKDALAASGGNAAPEGAVTDYGTIPELPEPLEINWPTLNRQALGCGVEDRSIHCRYAAAEYGWEDGVDRAIECVPAAIYDADQMREYGKACAAASAPNAALVAALRNLLHLADEFGIQSGVCCCGDDMKRHGNPMDCGHSPVDSGEYYTASAIEEARKALSAAGKEVGS